jgi:hypothetical protein
MRTTMDFYDRANAYALNGKDEGGRDRGGWGTQHTHVIKCNCSYYLT